ncbi:MAG: hypothetical protein HND44_19375 [Chloroflexi bacterium]|nr:hypothetical protein [Ardenticatenaceae bacterium]NOG36706.1 hypothetical protein [Chloroflexota bacterium]
MLTWPNGNTTTVTLRQAQRKPLLGLPLSSKGMLFQTAPHPHLLASHQPVFHQLRHDFSRSLTPWRTIRGMETYQIQEGAVFYYLTFTVIEWLPVFVAEEPCQILTDSLNQCHHHKSLRVNAFVLMPTHAHVMLFDADFDNERLRHTIRDIRQFTGRQLADYSEKHLPAAFAQVMQGTARTDRARQFWQQSKHAVAILRQAQDKSGRPNSGRQKCDISMTTRCARGWCGKQRPGGFRRQPIGCWTRRERRM